MDPVSLDELLHQADIVFEKSPRPQRSLEWQLSSRLVEIVLYCEEDWNSGHSFIVIPCFPIYLKQVLAVNLQEISNIDQYCYVCLRVLYILFLLWFIYLSICLASKIKVINQ